MLDCIRRSQEWDRLEEDSLTQDYLSWLVAMSTPSLRTHRRGLRLICFCSCKLDYHQAWIWINLSVMSIQGRNINMLTKLQIRLWSTSKWHFPEELDLLQHVTEYYSWDHCKKWENIREVDQLQVTVSEGGKQGFYSRSLAFFGNEIFRQRESGTDPDNKLFFSNLQKMSFYFILFASRHWYWQAYSLWIWRNINIISHSIWSKGRSEKLWGMDPLSMLFDNLLQLTSMELKAIRNTCRHNWSSPVKKKGQRINNCIKHTYMVVTSFEKLEEGKGPVSSFQLRSL